MPNVTTFGTLKSELAGILGRAPADPVYQMVTSDINSELKLTIMERTETLTEAGEVGLPRDFLSMVSVYREGDPRVALRPTSPQALQRGHQNSGIPQEYAIVNDHMLLNPEPGTTESIKIRYIQKQDEFEGDDDTNKILTRYPQIYIMGSLYYHAMLQQDFEAASGWFPMYEKAKNDAKTADDALRYAGGPGKVVPRVVA